MFGALPFALSFFVILPVVLSRRNVAILRRFVADAKEHDVLAIDPIVDPVTCANMNPVFRRSLADWFRVSKIATSQTRDPSVDSCS